MKKTHGSVQVDSLRLRSYVYLGMALFKLPKEGAALEQMQGDWERGLEGVRYANRILLFVFAIYCGCDGCGLIAVMASCILVLVFL